MLVTLRIGAEAVAVCVSLDRVWKLVVTVATCGTHAFEPIRTSCLAQLSSMKGTPSHSEGIARPAAEPGSRSLSSSRHAAGPVPVLTGYIPDLTKVPVPVM